MAVNPAQLQADLAQLFEPSNHPASVADAAVAWAQIMGTYALPVTPPSTTVLAAQAALQPAIAAAIAQPFPASATALDLAFVSFAATIYGGMPVMPPSPPAPVVGPGWAAQLGSSNPTVAAAAASFANFIDVWFKSTGWT